MPDTECHFNAIERLLLQISPSSFVKPFTVYFFFSLFYLRGVNSTDYYYVFEMSYSKVQIHI